MSIFIKLCSIINTLHVFIVFHTFWHLLKTNKWGLWISVNYLWFEALPLTASCLCPLPELGFSPGHVRELPVTEDYAVFLLDPPLSSPAYNWLVATKPRYGRKNDTNWDSEIQLLMDINNANNFVNQKDLLTLIAFLFP